jgi:SAM-dependent methyltransferase
MHETALRAVLRTARFQCEEKVIIMRSIKSSVHRWQTAGARLAVLIIMVQALGLRAGLSQEIAPPRLDEQFSKQEKIYRSRGADRPAGYVIGRGLSDYAGLLPSGFCDELGRLDSSDRWLDIGAGTGQAIMDYYVPEDAAAQAEKCGRFGAKAHAVAMSIEDRRTDKWQQLAATLGDERIRYLTGKRLRHYSLEELGTFQIITDVFGGFSYTENLSRFVDQVLRLLAVGGAFYTLVPGVHLEHGKNKLGILYLTELEDAAGRPLKVCSWLKQSACAKVTCESKSDWKRPTELITLRKTCSNVSIPRLKLWEFEAGYPPTRRFQVDP